MAIQAQMKLITKMCHLIMTAHPCHCLEKWGPDPLGTWLRTWLCWDVSWMLDESVSHSVMSNLL